MARTEIKKKKGSKQARRRAARRRRMIRYGAICLALIAVCVGLLIAMPAIQRARTPEDRTVQRSPAGAQNESEGFDLTAAVTEDSEEPVPTETPEPTPSPTPSPTPEPTEEPTPEPTAIPEDVTITITGAGDCTFGGCLKHDTLKVFKKYVDNYGYDYFFDKVRPLFQQDDLTIINLEGPLTDVGKMTDKSGICFCGDPAWTGIMTGSSIELCNMANNHSMDMGAEGMQRTAQALDEAGIGYCGYSRAFHTTIKGVRITALGFDKWNNKQPEVVEAVRRERPDCDILIVIFHWGWEMQYKADKDQRTMGHAIIDAGADLVLGGHPHVFGGVEQYKGKYIAYSLGNFCFGGHTNPSDKRTMIFQQTFVVSATSGVSDGGINILPCMVSGTTKTNDFQPYVLGGKAGVSLLRSIAGYSNLNSSTKWMPNSYPEQMGLIPKSDATLALEAANQNGLQNVGPTAIPGALPTAIPGAVPTAVPGALPTAIPGALPTAVPGAVPAADPFSTDPADAASSGESDGL